MSMADIKPIRLKMTGWRLRPNVLPLSHSPVFPTLPRHFKGPILKKKGGGLGLVRMVMWLTAPPKETAMADFYTALCLKPHLTVAL